MKNTEHFNKNLQIYGRQPILDAIEEGSTFEKIFLQRGMRGDFEKNIKQLAASQNIPLAIVPKEKLNRITRKNHQGIIGIISPILYYKVEDVITQLYEKGLNPLLVVLDGVTDIRNFGAIARSTEVLGAHAIVIPMKGGAIINADALKTSAGALTRLIVCREPNLESSIILMSQLGVSVYGAFLDKAAKRLDQIDLTGPSAIIFGDEHRGISPAVLSSLKERFIIPQLGKTDSLNVSVAAGIALYEAVRQRII